MPAGEYVPGERVSATFHAGCPRNNLRTNDTFLTVERKTSSGWTVVSHQYMLEAIMLCLSVRTQLFLEVHWKTSFFLLVQKGPTRAHRPHRLMNSTGQKSVLVQESPCESVCLTSVASFSGFTFAVPSLPASLTCCLPPCLLAVGWAVAQQAHAGGKEIRLVHARR